MSSIQREITEFIEEQDVKFVRLAFCDIFGTLKNISISTEELKRAFSSGISFDASSIKGFKSIDDSDLFLIPNADTMQILPWRPAVGSVIMFYCDLKNSDNSYYINDCRKALTKTILKAEKKGYKFGIGGECEFYLFKLDNEGDITNVPFDNGGYLDVAPLDKGENIRREICLTLQEMGFYIERSHHESGPGQMEIDFKYGGVVEACDNLITFKSVVKAIAARNGLYASFTPKPLKDKSGSGLHVNISLKNESGMDDEQFKKRMIAGLLNRLSEICIFCSPHVNSYERLGSFEAPSTISWGYANRDVAIRVPHAEGEYSRIELRTPDSAANPYLLYNLICEAVIEGIENENIQTPKNCNSTDTTEIGSLPTTLEEAIAVARKSEFLKRVLPKETLEAYLAEKEKEVAICRESSDYYKKGREILFPMI